MNNYLIQQKVKTLSYLENPFTHNGFHFENWEENSKENNAFLVEKKIDAENVQSAMTEFQKDIVPLINRMSFVGQCYYDIVHQPYLIYKNTNNSENSIALKLFKPRNATGLPFHADEIASLENISSFQKDSPFLYINESTNSSTHFSRLIMLLSALEGIAGEKEREPRCECGARLKCAQCGAEKPNYKTYGRDVLIEILGGGLYNELFGGRGLRHKLAHGTMPDISKDYIDSIYTKIVEFFNNKYSTKINTEVIAPQRHPFGNYIGLERAVLIVLRAHEKPDLRYFDAAFANDLIVYNYAKDTKY